MQDKNVDFCGILNLLSALKKRDFPRQSWSRSLRASRRRPAQRSLFLSEFLCKSSSFNEMTVVCCVATRRR